VYPTAGQIDGRIAACWNSGEKPGLLWFDVKMWIPPECLPDYQLALYVLDYDYDIQSVKRSETITIYDISTDPWTELSSVFVAAGEDFKNGEYLVFECSGLQNLLIRVSANTGVNSILSGIFVDCEKIKYAGRTIGFWKTNIWKALTGRTWGIQVSKEDLKSYLAAITAQYGATYPWLNFPTTNDDDLQQALNTFRFMGWNPATGLWATEPTASNMAFKFEAQALATLLNVQRFDGLNTKVTIDPYGTHTVAQWIDIMFDPANIYTEYAKNIAEGLNIYPDPLTTLAMFPDVNDNGKIDISDVSLVARALWTNPSNPHGTGWDQYNKRADINQDGSIDVIDLSIATLSYGEIMP